MNQLVAPFVIPGYEPGLEGNPKTPEERSEILSAIKQQRYVQEGMESPVVKAAMSGAVGFGLGAFISMMSSSFAFEDPFRNQNLEGKPMQFKVKEVFKDMGKGMWKSGSGFGKVGALYAGSECIIEGYRARNDIWNSVWAGAFSGAVLARHQSLRGMFVSAAGFAAFSFAIDTYMRWDSKDEDA